jgi:hypothetical protein
LDRSLERNDNYEAVSLKSTFLRFRYFIIPSLLVSLLIVPFSDQIVVQTDRNRSMAYGEIFWQEGFGVYTLDDEDLRENYDVPEDHLLPPGFELNYEYPILSLFFYSVLAAIEPGEYNPHHPIVNWILVVFAHLNLILFLHLSQRHWYKSWLTQVFGLYYILTIGLSVFYAKEEPLADFLLLSALVFSNRGKQWQANIALGLAVNVKVYPILAFPFILVTNPLASVAFIIMNLLIMIPMLLTGSPLFSHLINSIEYTHFTANPLFIGLTFTNPFAILAPILVILACMYSILKLKHLYNFKEIKNLNWIRIIVFLYPIILIFYSFIQAWYYVWFIPLILLLKYEEEMKKYRWLLFTIWIAHFLGIILNFNSLWEWTIMQFFAHIRL